MLINLHHRSPFPLPLPLIRPPTSIARHPTFQHRLPQRSNSDKIPWKQLALRRSVSLNAGTAYFAAIHAAAQAGTEARTKLLIKCQACSGDEVAGQYPPTDTELTQLNAPEKPRRGRPRNKKNAAQFPLEEPPERFQASETSVSNHVETTPKTDLSTSSSRRGRPKKLNAVGDSGSNSGETDECSIRDGVQSKRGRAKRVRAIQDSESSNQKASFIKDDKRSFLETESSMRGQQANPDELEGAVHSNEASSSRVLNEATVQKGSRNDSSSEIDDIDYPLWVEEDDPTWPEEEDEMAGWGFRLSDIFDKPKIKSAKGGDGEDGSDDDDDEEYDWDGQPDRWTAKEISCLEWETTVFYDPSPLVVLMFQRYGKRSKECFQLLTELENAANQIWDSKKLPPRMVKIDASLEIDLASALRVKEYPVILFIKAGKLLHQLTGPRTTEDLLRIISYFYYGAGRPSCLNDNLQSPIPVSKVP